MLTLMHSVVARCDHIISPCKFEKHIIFPRRRMALWNWLFYLKMGETHQQIPRNARYQFTLMVFGYVLHRIYKQPCLVVNIQSCSNVPPCFSKRPQRIIVTVTTIQLPYDSVIYLVVYLLIITLLRGTDTSHNKNCPCYTINETICTCR